MEGFSIVRCLCSKCPVGPRLASFPELPTLVFSSQVSQSGKDLFPFNSSFIVTPQLRSPNCKGQHENSDPSCTPPEGKGRSSIADGGESRQMGKNTLFSL